MSERTYGGHTLAELKEHAKVAWYCPSDVIRELIAAAEEVEQLRSELATANKEIAQYIAGVNKLRAENERLTKEFHDILAMLRTGATKEQLDYRLRTAQEARRALGGVKPPTDYVPESEESST